MTSGHYRFRLGEFECISIRDGNFNYPLESFFANAPGDRLAAVLRRKGMPTDHISTPYTCLFINTGTHRVMVDTGAGALAAGASRFFPGVDHSTTETGHLVANLRAAGIEPSEVDTVIITHAHPDHIAGTLDEQGGLVFGGARYFVGGEEWEYWMSEAAAETAPAPFVALARQALNPLRSRVSLVEAGDEIVPGIHAVAAPGHTPGHLALSVRSADEQLLHTSDSVLHPLHLEHPQWIPIFDTLPEQASASKQRIFDRAVREKALVFAHHFPPFPNLGWVIRAGVGWNWHPVASSGDPLEDHEEPTGAAPDS